MKIRIEKQTLQNPNYRRVLSTTTNQQLVLMSLKPEEHIGMEKHPNTTQFIKIERGVAKAYVNGKLFIINAGESLIVSPGELHDVWNLSREDSLKLYTIYSPPEHPPDLIQRTKETY